MYRRAVPYDEQLAGDLTHEVLQEAYRVLSLEGALLLDHVGLAFERDAAHRRKVLPGEPLLEYGGLADRGIGAHHRRKQVEARLIAEYDSLALFQRPFLRDGHLSCFQFSMASSSL